MQFCFLKIGDIFAGLMTSRTRGMEGVVASDQGVQPMALRVDGKTGRGIDDFV
jgi:hypothetical protein